MMGVVYVMPVSDRGQQYGWRWSCSCGRGNSLFALESESECRADGLAHQLSHKPKPTDPPGSASPLACAYCGTFHDSTACPPELRCHVCDHPLGTTAPVGCSCDCHPPGGAS